LLCPFCESRLEKESGDDGLTEKPDSQRGPTIDLLFLNLNKDLASVLYAHKDPVKDFAK
jgi:hypothetical protein